MNPQIEEFVWEWKKALLLDGFDDLEASGAQELSLYTGEEPAVTRQRLHTSEDDFARLWHSSAVNPHDEESLVAFYNKGLTEAYGLMRWHCLEPDKGPIGYVAALRMAQQRGATTYLDYGSGIGSGGLLFAARGFDVWLADIAGPLLDFSKWRLARRGLSAHFIDLRHERLPHETFDVVTCFDVLEHVEDPVNTLRQIRTVLKRDGILIVRAPFGASEDKPMHIVHDQHIWKRFRRVGFCHAWHEGSQYHECWGGFTMVMEKASAHPFRRMFFAAYDSPLLDTFQSMLGKWRVRPATQKE